MRRIPFYTIPEEAYLLVKRESPGPRPEEAVRQWVVYELIRAYGYPLYALTVEAPVRSGSGHSRVDILIRRDGKPWALVECKRPEFRKGKEALDQAIAYAKLNGSAVEYVVYTNGTDWHVQRRIGEGWMTVQDLPRFSESSAALQAECCFEDLVRIAGPLHQLDKSLSGDEAVRLMSRLGRMFAASSQFTEAFSHDLVRCAEFVFRVAQNINDRTGDDFGDLAKAWKAVGSYQAAISGIAPQSTGLTGEALENELHYFAIHLEHLARTHGLGQSADGYLIDLLLAASEWRRSCHPAVRVFPETGRPFAVSLRRVLETACASGLGVRLPLESDSMAVAGLRSACKGGWEYEEGPSQPVGPLRVLWDWIRRWIGCLK